MSTTAGYAVLKGISFEQLVWFCARAFIERDDQSLDVYEGYRIKALEETLAENRAELDRVLSWTDAEYHEYRDEQLALANQRYQKTFEVWKQENTILDAMLQTIEAWQPPSSVPPEIKQYMLEQIQISKNRDPDEWLAHAMACTGRPARDKAIGDLRDEIAADQQELAGRRVRLAHRQAWVRDLEASVPRPANFDPPK